MSGLRLRKAKKEHLSADKCSFFCDGLNGNKSPSEAASVIWERGGDGTLHNATFFFYVFLGKYNILIDIFFKIVYIKYRKSIQP